MKKIKMVIVGLLIAVQSYAVDPFVLSFKTTSIANFTSNKNILAAYITKMDGTYVDTIGLYATSRYMQYLGSWRSKSGLANKAALLATPSSADAWMGATRANYSAPSSVVLSWDLKDKDGNLVPNGDYQIHLDLGHRENREKHDYFVFTKDSIQSVRSKSNIGAGLFTAISIAYTPPPLVPVTDLMIEGPVAEGTMMELSWTGIEGQTYGVETNLVLSEETWNSWTSGIFGAGVTIILNPPVTETNLFYRVITE